MFFTTFANVTKLLHKLLIFMQNKYQNIENFNDVVRLGNDFFRQDAVSVARQLLGKKLVRQFDDGTKKTYVITATEAYLGAEDKACHASKGRTKRTEVMFHKGGVVYVYLIYGMYWMLNFVTGVENHPEAVLICGIDEVKGSGRVGRTLQIDKTFYNEDLQTSKRIWVAESDSSKEAYSILEKKRVGVDYADEWKDKLWRFEIDEKI